MLIALDLDGTLLREDKSISDLTLDMLARCRAAGHRVALSTGRPPVLQGVRYTGSPVPFWDGAVYCNGAQIVAQGRPLGENYLQPAQWSALYHNLCAHHVPFRIGGNPLDGGVVCNFPIHRFAPHYKDYAPITSESLQQPVTKAFLYPSEYWTMEKIRACVPPGCQMLALDGGQIVNILKAGVSKAQGIADLAAHFGLGMEDVIAFGDDRNDLELLQRAGTGVAMGNSRPEILEQIPLHTLSNEEDGVAVYLRRLLLDVEA